uniref:Uncharacterized protein n=1 Tax=Arundo donax TaxID=35708 RepID=A0A0A8YEU2_ARUDO
MHTHHDCQLNKRTEDCMQDASRWAFAASFRWASAA